MGTGHPDWFKGIVLYGIGPEDEFIPIRTDELGNLHVGYGTHAITHQDGGSDEISCEGLEGILHLEQKSSWVKVSGKPTTFTPSAHKTSHQNGGGDEISVAGLSGVLADGQTPATHGNTVHSPHMVEVDGTEPLTGDWDVGSFGIRAQTLTADGLTTGRVVFAGENGLLSDDPGLVWDNSNKRLGIGIAPGANLLNIGKNHNGFTNIGINNTNDGTGAFVGQTFVGYDGRAFAVYLAAPSETLIPEFADAAYFDSNAGVLNGFIVSANVGGIRFYTHGRASGNMRMNIGDSGNIGVDQLATAVKFDVNGSLKATSFTITGASTLNSLDVTNKSLLRGNAGASLLATSITVSTTWQTWDLSSIVGSRVAVVLIKIYNETGTNHSYAFAPTNNDAYYNSSLDWVRGTSQAQVEDDDYGFIWVITSASGVAYVRGDANHANPTGFTLVGFM
jgi:hypothetical protein